MNCDTTQRIRRSCENPKAEAESGASALHPDHLLVKLKSLIKRGELLKRKKKADPK